METAIASLYRWLPEHNGVSRTGLTSQRVEVRRLGADQVALVLQRDFDPPTVTRLTAEAARHVAALLIAAADPGAEPCAP